MGNKGVTDVFGGNGTTQFITGPPDIDPMYLSTVTARIPVPNLVAEQIDYYEVPFGVLKTWSGADTAFNRAGTNFQIEMAKLWAMVISNPSWNGTTDINPLFTVQCTPGVNDIIGRNIRKLEIDILQIEEVPKARWWMDSDFAKYGWVQYGRGRYGNTHWINRLSCSVDFDHGIANGAQFFLNQGYVANVTAYPPQKIPKITYTSTDFGSGSYPEWDTWAS